MSFISSLGAWLRKVSKSFMSATISGKTITLTRHNGDTVTLTTQDTTYEQASQSTSGLMSKEDKAIIDNLDNTYAKLTGTLVDNPITRTSPSNHTFGIQHGYDTGNEGEICDIGWDYVDRDGALICFNSASHLTLAGRFSLVARDATNSSELNGLPDGTLKWNNNTVLTTANGLPLSGGVLRSGNSSISLHPSFGIELSAQVPYIDFHHANSSTDYSARIINNDDGQLVLFISKDASVFPKALVLKSDGTLTWNGKNIAVVDSVDTTVQGYVRLTNGLQILWGSGNVLTANVQTGETITFEKPFSAPPCIFTTPAFGGGPFGYGYGVQFYNRSATGCTFIIGTSSGGTTSRYTNGAYNFLAIGPWA